MHKRNKQFTEENNKRRQKQSQEYLKENLFQNPNIIKYENCTYSEMRDRVIIYYDELKDIFAIVNSKTNNLLDFGIATELKYSEIFAFKSLGTLPEKELCLSPNEKLENNLPFSSWTESKELEVYEEKYILSYETAIDILREKYGPNFVAVQNGEFKIYDWQAAKKIEHADVFDIKFEDYGFSKNQAVEINRGKDGIVGYIRRGNRLPSMDLIRVYQNAIKNFCEDPNQSNRDNLSTFRGEPSIIFFNKKTRNFVIFNGETKIFVTTYRLSERNFPRYVETHELGEN